MTEKLESKLKSALDKIYKKLVHSKLIIQDNNNDTSIDLKESSIHSIINRIDTIKDLGIIKNDSTTGSNNIKKKVEIKRIDTNLDFLYPLTAGVNNHKNTSNDKKKCYSYSKELPRDIGKDLISPLRLLIRKNKSSEIHDRNMKDPYNKVVSSVEDMIREDLKILFEVRYMFVDGGNSLIRDNKIIVLTPGSFVDTGTGSKILFNDTNGYIYPENEEIIETNDSMFERYGFPKISKMEVLGFTKENWTTAESKKKIKVIFHMEKQGNALKKSKHGGGEKRKYSDNVIFNSTDYAKGNPIKNEMIIEIYESNNRLNDEINKLITVKELGDTLMAIYARKFIRSLVEDGSNSATDSVMVTQDICLTTRCMLMNVPVMYVVSDLGSSMFNDSRMLRNSESNELLQTYLKKHAICSYYYPSIDSVDINPMSDEVMTRRVVDLKQKMFDSIDFNLEAIKNILIDEKPMVLIGNKEIQINIDIISLINITHDASSGFLCGTPNVNAEVVKESINFNIKQYHDDEPDVMKKYTEIKMTGWQPSNNSIEFTGIINKKIARWGIDNREMKKNKIDMEKLGIIQLSYYLIYIHNILVMYKNRVIYHEKKNESTRNNYQEQMSKVGYYEKLKVLELFHYIDGKYNIASIDHMFNSVDVSHILSSIYPLKYHNTSIDNFGFVRGADIEKNLKPEDGRDIYNTRDVNSDGKDINNDKFSIPKFLNLDTNYIVKKGKNKIPYEYGYQTFASIISKFIHLKHVYSETYNTANLQIQNKMKLTKNGGNNQSSNTMILQVQNRAEDVKNVDYNIVWDTYRAIIKEQIKKKFSDVDYEYMETLMKYSVEGIDSATYPYFSYINALIMNSMFVSILVDMVVSGSINFIGLDDFWRACNSPGPYNVLEYTDAEYNGIIESMKLCHYNGFKLMQEYNKKMTKLILTYNTKEYVEEKILTNKNMQYNTIKQPSNSNDKLIINQQYLLNNPLRFTPIIANGGRQKTQKKLNKSAIIRRRKSIKSRNHPYRFTRKHRNNIVRRNANRHKTQRI